MTDQQDTSTNNAPKFMIRGQYIKDLSFENPHSPHTLIRLEEKPKIDVSVSLKAQRLNDQNFELILNIVAHATGKENTLFLIELDYGSIVQVINIPDEKLEPLLFIDCAAVLFPFARRVIADVTRDGGFQPIMLEPIDFAALYEYNKRQQTAAKAG